MNSSLTAAMYLIATFLLNGGAPREESHAIWEADNPIQPIPASPLGIDIRLDRLRKPPTPETVRLGRWLFSMNDSPRMERFLAGLATVPRTTFRSRSPCRPESTGESEPARLRRS